MNTRKCADEFCNYNYKAEDAIAMLSKVNPGGLVYGCPKCENESFISNDVPIQ